MSQQGLSGPSGFSRPSAQSFQSGLPTGPDLTHPSARPSSTSLRGLSDRELLSKVKALVAQERATTLEILVHLIEVERRRLHLGLGYPSLFEYCTRHLGYSSSAASRRIQSARCIRDFPEVYGLLEKNAVTLVTVSLVAGILDRSNCRHLFARIGGKSQREVEAIVAEYRPPVGMRDRARPVLVAAAKPADTANDTTSNSGQVCPITPSAGSEISPSAGGDPAAAGSASGPLVDGEAIRPTSDSGEGADDGQAAPSASLPPDGSAASSTHPAPRFERKFLVQFLAADRFMNKLEKAKALLSNKNGSLSYEAVLEAALDEFLKDHDPEKRSQRREERRTKSQSKTNQPRQSKTETPHRRTASRGGGDVPRRGAGAEHAAAPHRDPEPSRRIPDAVRDTVFARDKGRCTYVGSTGGRCDATRNLEIDHVVPFAKGGSSAIGNLRLLCERHNKLEAERTYGVGVTKRFRSRE